MLENRLELEVWCK